MSFADVIHAITFAKISVGMAIQLPGLNKLMEEAQLKIRMDLREATRFVLDDDFTRSFVAKGGDLTPAKAISRTMLANAPFEKLWVEYSNDVRVEHGHALGYNNDPDRTPTGMNGLLIRRIRKDPGEYLATHFSLADAGNEEALIPWSPLAIRISCSGEMPRFNLDRTIADVWSGVAQESGARIDDYKGDVELDMTDRMQSAMAWGFGQYNAEKDEWAYFLEDEVKKYGSFWIEPYFHGPMIDMLVRSKSPYQRQLCRLVARMVAESCQEMRGIVRMVITILSMINCVPIIYHHHEAKGFQRKRLRNIPYLSHSTVTIHGEKTKHLAIVDRAFHDEHQRRRAAHPVRGHWRNVEWRKGRRVTACAHEPTLRDGDYAMCGKCEAMLRWIDHYTTGGDGFEGHDYKVTR